MGLGNFLGSLFGGSKGESSTATQGEAVEYDGFTITPAPIKEGGQYRTAGTISRAGEGEQKQVPFIRADNNSDLNAAMEHSVRKGKQIIDEQGMAVLERDYA